MNTTVQDSSVIQTADLASNFFARHEDVGKNVMRTLRAINAYYAEPLICFSDLII